MRRNTCGPWLDDILSVDNPTDVPKAEPIMALVPGPIEGCVISEGGGSCLFFATMIRDGLLIIFASNCWFCAARYSLLINVERDIERLSLCEEFASMIAYASNPNLKTFANLSGAEYKNQYLQSE